MRRRDFVHGALGMAAGMWTLHPPRPMKQTVEVLFKDGLVFDGTGAPPTVADLLTRDGRVVEIGRRLPGGAAETVDCRGRAVCPGFIDIHSHTDLGLFINPLAESKIRQGVTTEITGQDGSSIGPWGAETAAVIRGRYHERYGVTLTFDDLGGFFAQLERQGTAVNLASMVGHGTVRELVIGEADRPATADEVARMQELVRAALAVGACGLSTGLEYVPGAFAPLDELVAVATPLRDTGLPYSSHMRNEDDQLLGAIEEALNVGRLAGVPVQVSHLKAQGQRNWRTLSNLGARRRHHGAHRSARRPIDCRTDRAGCAGEDR